jgi:xanthosine utilization system XapX-like protein
MSSFSFDFTPIFNIGIGLALALLASLSGLLGLVIGFEIFKWLWNLLLNIFSRLAGRG